MSYYDKPYQKPRRSIGWRIFAPLMVFLLILGLYSAYWLWARAQLTQGIDAWIEAERARGMTVEFTDKRFGGYPFRFALTLDDPVYGNPRRSQRWEGETLQLVMQPWNWQHVIARSPGENRVFERGMEGWARLGPKSAGSLSWTNAGIDRVSIAVDDVDFDLAGELTGTAEAFEFHLRQYPGEPDTLQLETHWQAIRLDDTVPGADALGSVFGPSILRAEATRALPALASSRRLDRLPAGILSLGGEIRVPQLMVNWGPLEAGARASLRRNTDDGLAGAVGLRIDNADRLRNALETAGQLNDDTATAISALEAASADGRFLELSIRDDGLYMLGNQIIPLDLASPLG